ncbi:MAG TPA: DUF3710 domain-containing protein [Pseudonocardiaceae bacterium]|nr:DUF3710 domain-containing protein [Pseudonocardiaceae bacterium]
MFGRGRRGRHARGLAGFPAHVLMGRPEPDQDEAAPTSGPFDQADAPRDGVARLDLGSVRVPVPEGAQLQVEVDQSGPVRAVHVLIPQGQFTVNAFAVPRSAKLWNEVRRELILRLEGEGARVREHNGEWGREVTATRPDLVLHFIGVNGPRWLLRGVAAGPPENAPELVERLRELLRQTVVVRGDEPMPARAPLPLTLPQPMAEQLEQAAGRNGQQEP